MASALCLREVRQRSGVASLDDLESCELPLARSCAVALRSLPPPADNDPAPSWAEVAARPLPRFQRVLSKRLDKKNHRAVLETLDEEGRARLLSCGGPFAGAWQTASATSPGGVLEDTEYALTCRPLLGQAVCTAGATCGNVAKTGARALSRLLLFSP